MDNSKYKKIYDELLKYDIKLNYKDIPTPAYIQQQIIKCNNYQHAVERYFIEVTRDLATMERLFSIEKLNIETLKRNVLTSNEKIKKLPTGKEREAAVDELLEDKYKELLKLENDVNELKSLLSAIKQKQLTLKNVNSDIKALIKLMDQMVNRINIGHPDDPDIQKLSKIYQEINEKEKKLEENFISNEEDIENEDEDEDEDKNENNKLDENKSFIINLEEEYESSVIFDDSIKLNKKELDSDIIFDDVIESKKENKKELDSDTIFDDIIESEEENKKELDSDTIFDDIIESEEENKKELDSDTIFDDIIKLEEENKKESDSDIIFDDVIESKSESKLRSKEEELEGLDFIIDNN
jgi:hypothetical protein